jgi:hypothetical protein
MIVEYFASQEFRVIPFSLRRGFNELYMALTVSNRCVEDAQAETGKAGSDRNLCGGESHFTSSIILDEQKWQSLIFSARRNQALLSGYRKFNEI